MSGYIYLIPVLNIREYEIMFRMKAPSAVGLFINEPLVCLREGTSALKIYGIMVSSNSQTAPPIFSLTIYSMHLSQPLGEAIKVRLIHLH